MRVVVTSLAVALLAGCPSDPIDCRDLGRVEGPADNCVCPEPLVPVPADHPDYPGCECPAGTIPSGDTCVLPDGGPDDAGTDASPRPEEDGCVPVTLHRDADGDGRGDPDVTTTACPGLAGHVENADDCDDACDVCWEGVTETCDEADNDCDGLVDEGVLSLVGEPTNLTPGAQQLDTELRQRIAIESLEDGGALVFFSDSPDGGDGVVRVLRVSELGVAVGAPSAVNEALASGQRSISTTRVEDRIVVAFTTTTPGNVFARAYSVTDGTPLTPARQLNVETGASNVRVSAGGPGVIFVWEDDDTLVYQVRTAALSGPTSSATSFHVLTTAAFVTSSTWVGEASARSFVFFDSGLFAATFTTEGVDVRELEAPSGYPVDRVFLGPGHDPETFALMGADDTEARLAVSGIEGDRVVAEVVDTGRGFHIDGALASPALATSIRFAADAAAGAYLYQRRDGEWARSVVDVSGGNFGPRVAGNLMVYSAKAPDDSEDLVLRRLGCAP
jgi:hypothetical protein